MHWALLGLIGIGVGAAGTLIGAGGGFILMPVLVLMYPREEAALLASISLAVVFLNAASGSVAYGLQRRIDYRAGLWFAASGVPGAVLGALATGALPRRVFDPILGAALIAAALFLALRAPHNSEPAIGAQPGARPVSPTIPFNRPRGLAISFAVAFLSTMLGIGGGVMHVPALVSLLGFPVHVATATSHFVLASTSLAGTAVHAAGGVFHHGLRRTAALGVGVIVGAQLGARLARRAPPRLILRGLSLALALVGLRILYAAIAHPPA